MKFLKESKVTAIFVFLIFCTPSIMEGATFSVNTNADAGAGTLRQAILDINASALAGPHTIDFSGMTNTSAGRTISLASDLPVLTKPTIIDGFTAPSYTSGTPSLWIKGFNYVFSFTNTGANGSTIRGIIMTHTTSYAINLNGVSSITIQGCWIGLDNTGAIPGAPSSNKVNNHGIYVNNCTNITIGGTTTAQRNVISGILASGISIEGGSSSVTITGNYIGLNTSGVSAIANSSHGINAVSVSNLTIGGTAAGTGNVISGNTGTGINLDGDTTVTIAGNYIGLNASGSAAVANGVNGINVLNKSFGITIGGTTTSARNIISGNGNTGINIDNLCHGTIIKANYIGLNAAGTSGVGNKGHGIYINNSNNCIIGGSNSIERNIVSASGDTGGENGISLVSSSGHTIKGNFIGTSATGLVALANFDTGLSFTTVSSVTVGGSSFMDRNVMSGNGKFGVYSSALTNSTFTGNFIGVDSTGNAGLGNTNDGLYISNGSNTNTWTNNIVGKNGAMGFELLNSSSNTFYGNHFGLGYNGTSNVGNVSQGLRIGTSTNNTIGGSGAGQRNYFAGNTDNALMIDQSSTGNVAKGNYVGTDVTGLVAVPNTGIGIFIFENSSNNQVGGSATGEGNLVCCSTGNGGINVQVSSNNTIYGNIVGLDANLKRTSGFGNHSGGINIGTHTDTWSTTATNNVIGGTGAGMANTVSNNTGGGVTFNYWGAGTSQYNSAIGNSIYCNVGAGIVFSGSPLQEGVVAPTVTSRTLTGISGTGTTGNTIHIYSNLTGDGGVNCDCEGEVYLGSTVVAGGTWSFTYTTAFTNTATANAVTATQTTPNSSTSQFSSCTAPLPVSWISFNVHNENGATYLNWTTGDEKNNKYFEIQKSADGILFTSLGTEETQGSGTLLKNYEFVDANAYRGVNYYRIKQIDIDGKYSYSEVKTINNDAAENNLSVWPNPSTGVFNYSVNNSENFTISVFNAVGAEVMTKNIDPGTANVINQIDLSSLSAGVYQIRIISESRTLYSKITKY